MSRACKYRLLQQDQQRKLLVLHDRQLQSSKVDQKQVDSGFSVLLILYAKETEIVDQSGKSV